MVTAVSVECDPETTWQQKALAELQQALGQSLDLWGYCNTSGWTRLEKPTDEDAPYRLDPEIPCTSPDCLAQLTGLSDSNQPIANELSPGQYLIAIPLGKEVVATTTIQTDHPEVFVRLASLGGRFFRQQEEMARLREENDFFLKQVSDDFEELTFLRSMADRLGLGDRTHTIEQLVAASLPELGKSVHAEELYFVLNSPEGLRTLGAWHAEAFVKNSQEVTVVQRLIQQHYEEACSLPVVKNDFASTSQEEDFPGVRDFIIVPVSESDAPLGWFVAINRVLEDSAETWDFPEWRLNQHEFGTSEASLLSTAAAMTASHANNLSMLQEREHLLVSVVCTLVSAIEAKDQYTCGHSERVALYAKGLAKQLDYDPEACELLYLTGLLHDVGKIAINDAILNKPDQLTEEEFAEIQRHPEEGWKILQELKQLSYVLPGVLHHHERFDGKGYPDKLSGLDIPHDGRILAVADAYDAMTSNRAYRTGMPHEKAIGILRGGAGTQWDPVCIEAFLSILPEILAIRESYQPRSKPNRKPTQVSVLTE